ncbi:MAG TPA: aminodeoxychorismate/anthranilate synthase component II [Gemmatimonadales bacterium]|nr:aminodeoxychorismate/anthranilate synthase component II [Gemmatimonadales bacterium]HYT83543.1 aminodeoxychorismate/anthranilate synthase component II [Gemmatimonadales bacterium]
MLFVLDNYDSFTYNLVQCFGELGAEPVVYRNDALTIEHVLALKPTAAVLSPGPRTPADAGILVPLVRALAGTTPVLGVCLGHQAIGEAFGGRVVRADRLMHGKTCRVVHEEDELFDGIPSPMTGMRYHSLIVEPASLPKDLVITAWSADRPKDAEIMAMKHRRYPIYGVQFHPESIGTEHGKRLLENFLRIAHAMA